MKKVLLLGGFILAAVVIATGAVYGISRVSTGTASAQENMPEKEMVIAVEEVINGERFGGEVRITFEDPPELPGRRADAAGLFLALEEDKITLGTGAIEVNVSTEVFNDEEPISVVNASHDGDEVQLTVDENTVYYKDSTGRPEITKEIVEAGQLQLSTVLETGYLDEIGDNTMIRAWGVVNDGQIVADLVVYEPIQ